MKRSKWGLLEQMAIRFTYKENISETQLRELHKLYVT